MKKIPYSSRTVVALAAVLCLALTPVLVAQTHAGQGAVGQGATGQGAAGQGAVEHGAGTAAHLLRLLARFLDLDEAQRAQVATLAEETRTVVQPLREDLRAERAALRDLLQADDPDATAIGEQVLAVRGLGEQVRDALRDFDSALRALLTPSQLDRLDAFFAARRFLLHHRVAGPADGAGDDTEDGLDSGAGDLLGV